MKITKVKPNFGNNGIIKVGSSFVGKFDKAPKVGEIAWFSGDTIEDMLVTSKILSIDKDVDPGVSFIETMNGVYRIDLDKDEKLW